MFSYRWKADGVAIVGQAGHTLLLTDAHVGASIRAEVTGARAGYATATVESAPIAVTLASSKPTVQGTLASGYTLTVSPGTWSQGATFTYQWYAGALPIAGGTTRTLLLTSTHVGKAIKVEVIGTLRGKSVKESSDPSMLVVAPGTPTVSGNPAVGQTLTASPGTWASSTTLAYQWLADGVPISGATSRYLVLTNGQDGKAIRVRVTASKPSYATIERTSASTLRVMRWSTPTMVGTFAYGSTLTAKPGTWTFGASFKYQWYADGRAISGATYSQLKLGSTLRDKRISVSVIDAKAGHKTVVKTSAQSGKVATAATPKISGAPIYGATLKAVPGTWTPYTTFSYRWYADGAAISGATYSSLRLGSGLKDKRISVRVTGKKTGYATVTKSSAASARVATVATPTIAGTKLVTYTLTARPGTWTSGYSFSYRWYANGTAISGATYSSLRLSAGLAGKKITVRVTGSKSGYPTVAKTSSATAAIGYPLRTDPVSSYNCPSWAPIKGNADSMIYHMPYQRYYSVTKPEDCFRTEAAAQDAGYRRAKV